MEKGVRRCYLRTLDQPDPYYEKNIDQPETLEQETELE